jgi:hypothetical protein
MRMRWTAEQLAEFKRNGVLFAKRLFPTEEVALLSAELPDILERSGPKNLKEQKVPPSGPSSRCTIQAICFVA